MAKDIDPIWVGLLARRVNEVGLTPGPRARGRSHVGAAISDSVLHVKNLDAVRAGAVASMEKAWPDAATTSGFTTRLSGADAAQVLGIPGRSGEKALRAMRVIATVLTDCGIETSTDLAAAMAQPSVPARIDAARGVAHRAVVYLALLAGSVSETEVLDNVRRAARKSGLPDLDDETLAAVLAQTAASLDWPVTSLTAALYAYIDSQKGKPSRPNPGIDASLP